MQKNRYNDNNVESSFLSSIDLVIGWLIDTWKKERANIRILALEYKLLNCN